MPSGQGTAAGAAGRVLVVDDDPTVCKALARMLMDYDVVTAANGVEALDVLARDSGGFGVLLCDLVMPHSSGADFYAALAARMPELVPRLVIMTGGAVTPAYQDFLDHYPGWILFKPFTHVQLIALVRRVFDESG